MSLIMLWLMLFFLLNITNSNFSNSTIIVTGNYGLTLQCFGSPAAAKLMVIRGTLNTALTTAQNSYMTLCQLPVEMRPMAGTNGFAHLSIDYSAYVNINTTGVVEIGYTRTTGNVSAVIPSGAPLYIRLSYV